MHRIYEIQRKEWRVVGTTERTNDRINKIAKAIIVYNRIMRSYKL